MFSGFRGIFWIFDMTVLGGGGGGGGYCLGFICNFIDLGIGAMGTTCSCLLHHYFGTKLRKSIKEKNFLQLSSFIFIWYALKRNVLFIILSCLLSWKFQKLFTSMSIPAPTKLSDPLLTLHPPHHTHPV